MEEAGPKWLDVGGRLGSGGRSAQGAGGCSCRGRRQHRRLPLHLLFLGLLSSPALTAGRSTGDAVGVGGGDVEEAACPPRTGLDVGEGSEEDQDEKEEAVLLQHRLLEQAATASTLAGLGLGPSQEEEAARRLRPMKPMRRPRPMEPSQQRMDLDAVAEELSELKETQSELKEMLRLLVKKDRPLPGWPAGEEGGGGVAEEVLPPRAAEVARAELPSAGSEEEGGEAEGSQSGMAFIRQEKDGGALFEMCRADTHAVVRSSRPGRRSGAAAASGLLGTATAGAGATVSSSGRRAAVRCHPWKEMLLEQDTAEGVVHSCCPLHATWCSGCALAGNDSCEECLGGYVKIAGHCTACIDSTGWKDYQHRSCFDAECTDYKIRGLSSKEACCKCGGGQQAATPFAYLAETALLVSNYVRGQPVPRTAERYSLDEACELAKFGLTINGSTGQLERARLHWKCDPDSPVWPGCEDIWYLASLGTEPFEISCIITAHQTEMLNATATLTVRADWFSYESVGSGVVLWDSSGTGEQEHELANLEYMCGDEDPRTSSRRRWTRRRGMPRFIPVPWWRRPPWRQPEPSRCTFRKNCAAKQTDEWISINGTTGTLIVNHSVPRDSPGVTDLGTLSGQSGSAGGLCELSVHYWDLEGFPAGASLLATPVYRLKLPFTPLAPQPWKSFSYDTQQIFATVGERAPPLYLHAPQGELLRPERFSISCSESPSESAFAFDTTTGAATLGSHHAFTLDTTTGAIRVEPSADMTYFFDALTTTESRRQVSLHCSVIGHYNFNRREPNPWVSTPLQVVLSDNTCWIETEAKFLKTEDVQENASSEADCRRFCRNLPNCTHYQFRTESHSCVIPSVRCSSTASVSICPEIAAVEKITSCGERSMCLQLNYAQNWDFSGQYCPQVDSGFLGLAYKRVSVTAEDTLLLAPFDLNRETNVTNCSEGHYVLRRTNSRKDFQDNLRAVAECNGDPIACLDFGGDLASVVLSQGRILNVGIVTGPPTTIVSVGLFERKCPAPNISAEASDTEGGAEDLTMNPIWLDDASTTDEENDFALHPCSCFPVEWGMNEPVTAESLQDVPPGSGNQFYPSAFKIVDGEFVCEADATSFLAVTLTQVEDEIEHEQLCQDQCWSFETCQYYAVLVAGESKQCRLYSNCTVLVREAGVAGSLWGLPRRDKKYCRIADPQKCADVSTRRVYLGAGIARHVSDSDDKALDPASRYPCLYQRLLQQCDLKLLYEQLGINSCGVCTYADQDPVLWQYKRVAPEGLPSGYQLRVGCFEERYVPVPASGLGPATVTEATRTLTCSSGQWVSSDGSAGLSELACGACITVAAKDSYQFYQAQGREELWFTQRIEVELFVASNPAMRVSSDGPLEPAPIIRQPDPLVFRGDYTIYGAMKRGEGCVGAEVNESVVGISSSQAQVTVTIIAADPSLPVKVDATVNPTITLQAYGVFDGDDVFVPLRKDASYEPLNPGYTAASITEFYPGRRFQAMARGLSLYNQRGMPFVEPPWAEVGQLALKLSSISLNGTDQDVELEVTMNDILFNSDPFPRRAQETANVTYSDGSTGKTTILKVNVTMELDYWEEPERQDVLQLVTCDSPAKLDIGWFGGDSSDPGPLLRESRSEKCLAMTEDTYYKDSYLVVLEKCEEDGKEGRKLRQSWLYLSPWETVLQNLAGKNGSTAPLCMAESNEGPYIAWLRLVPCSSSSSSGSYLEQGPFTFASFMDFELQEQDCHFQKVSEGACPTQCGGSYKEVTWSIVSPARGSGQPCPGSTVKCGTEDCPNGEGSPGGFLMESFPNAAIGVKLLRSTMNLAECLQYNASGQEAFSVGPCDAGNKLQQLDSATLPTLLWRSYRLDQSQARKFTASQELKPTFQNPKGETYRYMSNLADFSHDCGKNAMVSRLNFSASQKPGISVTCVLATVHVTASPVKHPPLRAPRGDIIAAAYGKNCMVATEIEGGQKLVEMHSCDFAIRGHRWYWSQRRLVSELSEASELSDGELCLQPAGEANIFDPTDEDDTPSVLATATIGPCNRDEAILSFSIDERDRLFITSAATGAEKAAARKVCLGWLGSQVVFADCLGRDDEVSGGTSDDVMKRAEQQFRLGNGLLGMRDVIISCPGAAAVTQLAFNTGNVGYTCQELSSLGQCVRMETKQVDTDTPSLENLVELDIDCSARGVLKEVTPEYSLGGQWLRFKYICCMLTEPSAIVRTNRFVTNSSAEVEGVYCPLQERDISGRLIYQQSSCFNDSACVGGALRQMSFDHKAGAWCLQADCVSSDIAVPTETPPVLSGSNWDALEVLDFDYKPAVRGVSSAKKPERKPPQLIEFSAEEPEYAEECQDEVTPGQRGFDKEAMNDLGIELPQDNPCSLVASKDVGGETEGRASYTKSGNKEMGYGYTYSDVVDCWDRDISRQRAATDQKLKFGDIGLHLDIADALTSTFCKYLPDSTGGWGGFMAGADSEVAPKGVCKSIQAALVGAGRLTNEGIALKEARQLELADQADCKETTAGLSRIFCDLHCIRDAVKAGDRAILDSMEKAARVQTENTKLLTEYYTGLILDKLGEQGGEGEGGGALLQERAQAEAREAQGRMDEMFEEMRSWASSGTFGAAGTGSASRALSSYTTAGQRLLALGPNASLHGPNLTASLAQLIQRTEDLHATLSGAAAQRLSSASAVERRVFQYVTQKQQTLQGMNRLLGIHRHRSEGAKRGQQRLLNSSQARPSTSDLARQMERQSVEALLLSLDGTWWELRAIIDQHLQASSAELEAFTQVTGLLQDYMGTCSLAYPDVLKGYRRTLAASRQAKAQLQEAWQKAVPLYGLLASKVVDGDVFTHVARADVRAVDAELLLSPSPTTGGAKEARVRPTLDLAQLCQADAVPAAFEEAKQAVKRAAGAEDPLFPQMVLQLAIVGAELDAMQDRFQAAGLGTAPHLETVNLASERLALAIRQAAEGHDTVLADAVAELRQQNC